MIWMLLACAVDPEPETLPQLTSPRLLRRVSLDLRGTLPTLEELELVEQDPTLVQDYAQQWLREPAFEERLVLLLSERWHTRVEAFAIEAFDYGLEDEVAFERSVGEEPLRLAARVVVEERPWSEVVTADHTMANPLLREIWNLESESQEQGWAPAHYQDGRPHAGVLSTNGLWWRYDTNVSNMNRRRIAAVSRLLVCHDVLSRPISLQGSAGQAIEDAVRNDPACKTCHSALDPASAALFGFWTVVEYSEIEHSQYHPEREQIYRDFLAVEPAWYGTPVSGPADLGRAIAADPRFDSCAVESFSELMLRREVTTAESKRWQGSYDGYVLPLLETLLASPEYAQDDVRLLTPQQLASSVYDLTGFAWTYQGHSILDIDEYGLRQLAGGVDGQQVKRPQSAPGLTRVLVIQRLAEQAASYAAAQGLELDIEQSHWRLLAEHPSAESLAELEQLHATILAREGQQAADAALLTLLLRDPAFEAY